MQVAVILRLSARCILRVAGKRRRGPLITTERSRVWRWSVMTWPTGNWRLMTVHIAWPAPQQQQAAAAAAADIICRYLDNDATVRMKDDSPTASVESCSTKP